MDCDALDLEARQCRDATVSLYRIADRDPELVLGGARRDLGMAAGGDIRIDPEADRSGPPHANRNRGKHLGLVERFEVELVQPTLEREPHLVLGLAHA